MWKYVSSFLDPPPSFAGANITSYAMFFHLQGRKSRNVTLSPKNVNPYVRNDAPELLSLAWAFVTPTPPIPAVLFFPSAILNLDGKRKRPRFWRGLSASGDSRIAKSAPNRTASRHLGHP
jgi:hypothetical protein